MIKSNFETKKIYKKTLIIPENYTRNKMYIENVFAIEKIPQLAGFETKIGLFHSEEYNLTLILRRSRTGTVWFYTSTSNKRAARPKLYTKSLTRT